MPGTGHPKPTYIRKRADLKILREACDSAGYITAIDPDTKKPDGVAILRVGSPFAPEVVVVEDQEIYRDGKANANDIIKVSHAAGLAMGVRLGGAAADGMRAVGFFILPRVWKSSIPKPKSGKPEHYPVHHRVLKHLGDKSKPYLEQLAEAKGNNKLEVVDAWGILVVAMTGKPI